MNESIGGLDSEHMRVRMLIFGWTKHLKLWLSKTTSKHKTGQMVCVVRKKHLQNIVFFIQWRCKHQFLCCKSSQSCRFG